MVKITTFNLFVSNVHLVQENGKNILIDICEAGREGQIEKRLAKLGLNPSQINLIICTHGHYDHCGGAKYFQEKYKIPVMVGEGDLPMIEKGEMPTLVPYTFLDRLVKTFIANKKFFPAFNPDYVVKDNFDLSQFGINGQVFILPGHTHGSLAIAFGKDVFVGDLFRGGLIFPTQPARHFFHPQVEENTKNIETLLNKGYETFYCGHSGPISKQDLAKDYKKF